MITMLSDLRPERPQNPFISDDSFSQRSPTTLVIDALQPYEPCNRCSRRDIAEPFRADEVECNLTDMNGGLSEGLKMRQFNNTSMVPSPRSGRCLNPQEFNCVLIQLRDIPLAQVGQYLCNPHTDGAKGIMSTEVMVLAEGQLSIY